MYLRVSYEESLLVIHLSRFKNRAAKVRKKKKNEESDEDHKAKT